MRKALKIAFCIVLGGIVLSNASESAKIASRAQKSIKAGNFAKGYSQLERALVASRKESDRRSEARIFIAMGQIRTMSLDYDLADSLFSQIRNDGMDRTTRFMLVKSKMAQENARGKFSNAVSLCESIHDNELNKIEDPLQGAFYSECAIAYAGVHNGEKAEQALKMIDKRIDDDAGIYYWTKARMADLENNPNVAESNYLKAETRSVEANSPYMTANILYHRAILGQKTKSAETPDLFRRCKSAFTLMGLPNNAKRCEGSRK